MMIHKIKILGLAPVAILALSAVVASAASAQTNGILTSDGPVTQIAIQTGVAGSGANAFTLFGGKVECPNATYTGHKVETTPHTFLPSGSTRGTITPHYGKCTALGKPATVLMNGCDYIFEFTGTVGTEEYAVDATGSCPAGKHIQVKIFNSEANHISNEAFCTLTMTEKGTDYTGLVAKDTTNGHIDINGTIGGFIVHKEGSGVLCAKATTENGVFHFDLTISGKNEVGGATSMSISD